MRIRRKVLAFGQLPSSKGDLYTPVASKGRVQHIVMHNEGGSAEDVVLNYHDGTNEHQWFSQTIPAGDTLTLDFPGVGFTVEPGGRITGNTNTASTVTHKFSGVEEYVPGYVSSNLWSPPVNPHAQDDEFNGTNLGDWGLRNVGAGVTGTFGLNQIDSYDTSFTSGNTMRCSVNGDRTSWLVSQPPASSQAFYMYKSYTLPTNVLMWSRMRFSMELATIVNNNNSIALAFLTDTGSGYPGEPSAVRLFLNESDTGTIQAQADYVTSGGSTTGVQITTNTNYEGQSLEYVAIHKIGGTYHYWVGTDAGNWIWVTSNSSVGFTPDMVGFLIYNTTASNVGPGVHGIDFIRFIETDNFLL